MMTGKSLDDSSVDISFTDLFDVKKIQKMQDLFADTNGVASIITSPDGSPITSPSSFTRLCSEIIRKTEKGCKTCFKSDAILGQYHPEGPIVLPCLSIGLWDAGTSITVGGRQIANWLIGQVRNEQLDENQILKCADEIGIDRKEFLDAINEVPIMSHDKFQKIARLLFVFANELSEKAYANFQLKKESLEREKAVDLLRESEKKYRLIAENTADSLAVLDFNLNYTFLSPSVFSLLGYSPEEMLNLKFQDVSTPESWQMALQVLGEEMEMEKLGTADPKRSRIFITEQIRKDGRLIWVEATISFVRDEDGHPVNILAVSKDITKRKKAESILIAHKSIAEFSMQSSLDEILQKTLDEIEILTKSKIAFLHFVEADQKTLSLQTWSTNTLQQMCTAKGEKLHYPIDSAGVWVDCVHTGKPVIHNDYDSLPHKKGMPQGHAPVIRELVVPIFRNKKIVAIVGVGNKENDYDNTDIQIVTDLSYLVWDITVLKQKEKELRDSEEKYRSIFENVHDVFYQVDLQGKILKISPSIKYFSEFDRNEIIGTSVHDIYFNPNDRDVLLNALREKGELNYYELTIKTKTGKIKQVSVNARLIFDTDGQPNHIDGALRDITERKQSEKVLYESNERFRLILENMPILLNAFDEKGNIIVWNKACEESTGYQASEIICNPNAMEIFYPDAAYRESVWNSSLDPNSDNIYDLLAKCGEKRTIKWFDIHHHLTIPGWSSWGVGLDITEQKEADEIRRLNEASLKQLNDQLNEAQRVAQVGSWEWDLKSNKVKWSDELYRIYDLSPDTFNGNPEELLKVIHPDDVEMFIGSMNVNLTGGYYPKLEYRIIQKDGSVHHLSAKGNIEFDERGAPAKSIGIVQDITEQTHAEMRKHQQLTFSHSINEIAEIIISNENAVEILENANRIIGETLKLDHTLIYDISFKMNRISGLCEWLSHDHPDISATKGEYPVNMFLSPLTKIWKKKYLESHAGNIGEYFAKDESGEILHNHFKIKSLIWYPFAFYDHGYYLFTINQILEERKWTNYEIDFLESVAKLVNLALLKIRFLEEREQTEKQLQLLNTAIEQSPVSVVITNIEGNIEYVNPTFTEITGYSFSELKGQNPRLLQSGFQKAEFYEELWGKLLSGNHWFGEFHNKKKNGESYWESAVISPVKNKKGKIISYVAVKENITKRKLAEIELRESHEKFQKYFEIGSVGMCVTSIDKAWIDVNNQLCMMLGYSKEELSVLTWSEITHPDDLDADLILFNQIIKGEVDRYELDKRFIRKDGSVIYTHLSVTCQRHADHSINYFLASLIDITYRKRAEEELDFQANLLSQIGESVIATDTTGMITYWNRAAENLYGWLAEEAIGKNILDTTPTINNKHDAAEIFNSLTKGAKWSGEFLVKRKDGSLFPALVHDSPIFDSQGKLSGVIGVSSDISDRKQVQNELINAKEKAEESDRLKSAFLANMSHEIRTPLNSIIGFSELLNDPYFDQEQKSEFIKTIIDQGNNLLTVISDIMDLSMLDSKQIVVRKEKFIAKRLINDLYNDYKLRARKKGIEFKVNLPNDCENIQFENDIFRIKQVINNLISNALKFTGKGFVELGCYLTNNFLEFYVKDTGIGTPKEYHESIFERFRQVENTRTRKYGGNGLGLAISKNLAEIIGGDIRMESEPGKGSTFYFTIPINDRN